MTNEEMFADLKQFITTTMQQQFAEFEKKMDEKMDEKNRAQTEEILSAIAETTNPRFENVEADVESLDKRVSTLESSAA